MEFPLFQFVPTAFCTFSGCLQFSIHSAVHLSSSYFISSSVSGFKMTPVIIGVMFISLSIHANILSDFMDLFVSSLFKYSGTTSPGVSCHCAIFPTALSDLRFPNGILSSKYQGDGVIKYLGHLQIF